MSRAMLDTQVLSFGLALEAPTNAASAQQQGDAAALLKSLDQVLVSSIVVFELFRSPPQVVAKLKASGILDELDVVPLDFPVAVEASRILDLARSKEDVCPRCLNLKKATPCPKCNQLVSHQQKSHDAFVLATAAVLHDVDTLYSYDPGVHELAKFVKTVNVTRPPNVHGPLWDTSR